MNKYYVYGHYFKNDNELFYVGKGSGKRLNKSSDRSSVWKAATFNKEWYAKIIAEFLSEEEALDLESKIISETQALVNVHMSMRTKDISDNLLSSVSYSKDSPTGLIWKKESVGINGRIYRKTGEVAGVIKNEPNRPSRYIVKLKGESIFAHRLVWAIFNKLDSNMVIDHIDGNALNNKIENLRKITQELINRNITRKSKITGVVGVTVVERKRLNYPVFVASWYSNGKLNLKEFSTNKQSKEEALRLAIEWRTNKIKELNEQGAGYTDRHINQG